MGYGLFVVIGVKIVRLDCLVLDFDGDVFFGMIMQEFVIMVYYNIGVKVIIFNNEEMGMILDLQCLYYDKRFMQNRLINFDFVVLLEFYGVVGL